MQQQYGHLRKGPATGPLQLGLGQKDQAFKHKMQAWGRKMGAGLLLGSLSLMVSCGPTLSRSKNLPVPTVYTQQEARLEALLKEQERLFAELQASSAALQDSPTQDVNRPSPTQADLKAQFQALVDRYELYLLDHPDYVPALIAYGKLLRQIDQAAQAHVVFVRAAQLAPEVAVVHQQLGNHFAERGQYDQAYIAFSRAIELAPDEAVYAYSLGELLHAYPLQFLEEGIFSSRPQLDTSAQAAFQKARDLAPQNEVFARRYAESFYDTENSDWAAALAAWEAVETRFPNPNPKDPFPSEALRLHKARCLLEQGQLNAAAPLLQEDVSSPLLQSTHQDLLARLEQLQGDEIVP